MRPLEEEKFVSMRFVLKQIFVSIIPESKRLETFSDIEIIVFSLKFNLILTS